MYVRFGERFCWSVDADVVVVVNDDDDDDDDDVLYCTSALEYALVRISNTTAAIMAASLPLSHVTHVEKHIIEL